MLLQDDVKFQEFSKRLMSMNKTGGCPQLPAEPAPVQAYIVLDPDTKEPPLFSSTKQIQSEARRALDDWCGADQAPRCWTFKELLSWKIPDHLLSTSAR